MGSQADIVIVDMTRTERIRYTSQRDLLNVSQSRARSIMITIGDPTPFRARHGVRFVDLNVTALSIRDCRPCLGSARSASRLVGSRGVRRVPWREGVRSASLI